jgi:cullin 5
MKLELEASILEYILSVKDEILKHENDEALLRAYISLWTKFSDQTNYLPLPFATMETNANTNNNSSTNKLISSVLLDQDNKQSKAKTPDSFVRKLMLDTWNKSIFSEIKDRLYDSAIKIVHSERMGEPFDSQLVIGVRESYVNLCSDPNDRLKIYKANFEKPYLESELVFYNQKTQKYIEDNGIISYLSYANAKLNEEQKRAEKYLETSQDSSSLETVNYNN